MNILIEERMKQHIRLAVLIHLKTEPMEQRLRFSILQILHSMPGYTTNLSVLTECVHELGLDVTRDQVNTQTQWLAEQDLLKNWGFDGVENIRILERGLEISEGRATHKKISQSATVQNILSALHRISLACTVENLEAELKWLLKKELIKAAVYGDSFNITHLGIEVSEGRSIVDGIKRPSPATLMRTAAKIAG